MSSCRASRAYVLSWYKLKLWFRAAKSTGMKSYSYIHYTKHFHVMPVWCQLLVWEVCMWGTWIRQDQGHSYNFEGEEACSYPCTKHTGKFSNYLSTYSTPVHNSLEAHTRLYTIETSTVALLKMLQQYTGALTGPKLVARLGVHSWLILFAHVPAQPACPLPQTSIHQCYLCLRSPFWLLVVPVKVNKSSANPTV